MFISSAYAQTAPRPNSPATEGSLGLAAPLILTVVILFCIMVLPQLLRRSRTKRFLAENNARLDYDYAGMLGIAQARGKVFVNVKKAQWFGVDEIVSVQKDSILQTKSNMWGMQFHSRKHCSLTLQVRSLDAPILVVPFNSAKQLDLWHARVSTFCDMA